MRCALSQPRRRLGPSAPVARGRTGHSDSDWGRRLTGVLVGVVLIGTVVVVGSGLFAVLRSAHVALLLAAILPFPVVLTTSEVLSALGVFRPGVLVASSSAVLGGLTLLVAVRWAPVDSPRRLLRAVVSSVRAGGWPRILVAAGVAGVLGVTFVVGVATAPNNPDSLNYHLPRVMQWFQQSGLGSFATPYPAQVYMPPGAETVVALLLAGPGEHAMFLAQWVSQGVLGLAVYSTARHVGVSRTPALGGVLLAVSAPLVVGEAATTQNDLVAAAAVLAAVALVTAPAHAPHRWVNLLGSLICVAYAVAVKPSVAVFGLPVAVWTLWALFRGPRRAAVAVLVLATLIGVSLNLGWMVRNQQEFGRPTGPNSGSRFEGDHLRAAVSNAVKNTGHNLAVPGPEWVNHGVEEALSGTSEAFSGAPVDDPRFSFTPVSVDSQRNEDRAANLLQFVLGCLAVLVVLLHPCARRRLTPVFLVAGSGYLVFSGLVQYQAWGKVPSAARRTGVRGRGRGHRPVPATCRCHPAGGGACSGAVSPLAPGAEVASPRWRGVGGADRRPDRGARIAATGGDGGLARDHRLPAAMRNPGWSHWPGRCPTGRSTCGGALSASQPTRRSSTSTSGRRASVPRRRFPPPTSSSVRGRPPGRRGPRNRARRGLTLRGHVATARSAEAAAGSVRAAIGQCRITRSPGPRWTTATRTATRTGTRRRTPQPVACGRRTAVSATSRLRCWAGEAFGPGAAAPRHRAVAHIRGTGRDGPRLHRAG